MIDKKHVMQDIYPFTLTKKPDGTVVIDANVQIPEEMAALKDPGVLKLVEAMEGPNVDRRVQPIDMEAAIKKYLESPRVKRMDGKSQTGIKASLGRLQIILTRDKIDFLHKVDRAEIHTYIESSLQDGGIDGLSKAKAPKTIEKEISFLHGFFQHMRDSCHVSSKYPLPTIEHSIFVRGEKQKSTIENAYRPYSAEDIKRLFEPAIFLNDLKKPHEYWAPLIALYTGARTEEIAQLKVTDIVQMSLPDSKDSSKIVGQHWAFKFADLSDIDPEDDGLEVASKQSKVAAKTSNAMRYAPIHPDLEKLGLLNYVKQVKALNHNSGLLFPYLTYNKSNGYSRVLQSSFKSLRERAGVMASKKAIHSFRHTIAGHLMDRKVSVDTIKAFLGHSFEVSGGAIYYVLGAKRASTYHQIIPNIQYSKILDLNALKDPVKNWTPQLQRSLRNQANMIKGQKNKESQAVEETA